MALGFSLFFIRESFSKFVFRSYDRYIGKNKNIGIYILKWYIGLFGLLLFLFGLYFFVKSILKP